MFRYISAHLRFQFELNHVAVCKFHIFVYACEYIKAVTTVNNVNNKSVIYLRNQSLLFLCGQAGLAASNKSRMMVKWWGLFLRI